MQNNLLNNFHDIQLYFELEGHKEISSLLLNLSDSLRLQCFVFQLDLLYEESIYTVVNRVGVPLPEYVNTEEDLFIYLQKVKTVKCMHTSDVSVSKSTIILNSIFWIYSIHMIRLTSYKQTFNKTTKSASYLLPFNGKPVPTWLKYFSFGSKI